MIRSSILIPAAIVFAGLIIAIGVYVVRVSNSTTATLGSPTAVRPVDPSVDHIIGNPTAPVKIVEYSDTDCEFCKQFQATMEQLMTEYAAGGKVAWIYRHFPVTDQDPNAPQNAAAAECAARLGGTNAFWRFIDAMQAAAPDGNQFDPADYGKLLPQFGIDAAAFNACRTEDTTTKKVVDDYTNGLASGASGAPYTVIVIQGAKPIPISGALTYSAMKQVIEKAISEVK
jgi:protein-disulfide isomerase